MAHSSLEPLGDTAPAPPNSPVTPWAAIRVQGRDARGFLQGQLTQDLRALTPAAGLRAALCTAQGRVIACTWLVETAPAAGEPGVWILLPGDLAETAAAALRRYVLRAKLTISGVQEHAVVRAWLADEPATLDDLFATGEALAVCHRGGRTWLRAGTTRVLSIPDDAAATAGEHAPPRGLRPAAAPAFELAAIGDGEPMVYAATREHWVPQMLNLDLVGGIGFAKGCYTGQEIVTRTQHRGQIKRRMLRFAAPGESLPSPGDGLVSGAARIGEVVRAARADGGVELLAVVSLGRAADALSLADGTLLTPLPLPYALEQR